MDSQAYQELLERSASPEALERSIEYLAEHLGKFLKKRERLLICFLEHKEGDLSWLMEQAALRCDAVPVLWGPDHRWQTLLRQAFYSKASAVVGPPLVILGLSKLKKYTGTPLAVRKVITADYPCPDWMIDGIKKGFDCEAGGCFSLKQTSVVAGFACGRSWGVHLRQEEYGVDIVDDDGRPCPSDMAGEIVIFPREAPELRYPMGDFARLETAPCPCGSQVPRLLDFCYGKTEDPDLARLGQYLQSWTSILDCRLVKGESGLEMEIICFPGEKLPKLPTAAKLVVRPWNPKNDEPFRYVPAEKNWGN